jgi:hypothetical protein
MFRIWRAYVQAKAMVECRRALLEGDIVTAKRRYSLFQDSELPRNVALGARIKLMENDIMGAKLLLEKAANQASRKKDKHNKYVLEYCNFYLSLMNKDGRHEEHRNKAINLQPTRAVFETLPLAPYEFHSEANSEDKSPNEYYGE